MRGVTIADRARDTGALAVDLADILRLLGDDVETTEWEVTGIEAVGRTAADELHRLADSGTRIPGRTLRRLAADVVQIVDGTFAGYRAGQGRPWVIIRAVDSSAFDVETDAAEVLAGIRAKFRDVTDLPSR